MKPKKQQSNYKAAPPVNGIMRCSHGHEWNVIDLNPERKTVNCPVCGDFIDIRQGLKHE